ncbi:MAG: glycoside hydrolase family 99-like domain-containing protein, partial [Victivallales bacterium]|nr:glycoside hydrolase family 99-like domain-containing protein [Victivallales bacterium]
TLYLEHWIDAFQKAKYRSSLKWAVMWANHNPPGSHSCEDWINVTKHWIGKYLQTPEYLRLNGKPAIFIWSPEGLRRDVKGSENVAELFAISDKMAKEAGLPGIDFYAMNDLDFKRLKAEGYVAQSTYHWWSDAPSSSRDNMFFSYKAVVDRAEAAWNEREKQAQTNGLPFIPVAETGWDGRPRHSLNTYIIYERTPQEFKRHLLSMKQWLDSRNQKLFILAPWNEWTEGSFIEPCSDFGFEMLRAIRDVFCKNFAESDDTCPTDLNLGSYDQFPVIRPVSQVSNRTQWDFQTEQSLLDWTPAPVANLQFTPDGCSFLTRNGDPIIASPKLKINAADFKRLEVVLSASPSTTKNHTDIVEVFWKTPFTSWNANASLSLPLVADGQSHTYVFDISKHPQWLGNITGLRIDPCGETNRTIVIKKFILHHE